MHLVKYIRYFIQYLFTHITNIPVCYLLFSLAIVVIIGITKQMLTYRRFKNVFELVTDIILFEYSCVTLLSTVLLRPENSEFQFKVELLWSLKKAIAESNILYIWQNICNVIMMIQLGILLGKKQEFKECMVSLFNNVSNN